MEQGSAAAAESRAMENSSEVVAGETHASPQPETAVMKDEGGRKATEEQGGEDRSAIQAQGSSGEEIAVAVARSEKRRKSYRPSLDVVEVKVDQFYDKTVFKRGLQVGTTRICCLVYISMSSVLVGLANTAVCTRYCCSNNLTDCSYPTFVFY